MSTLKDLNKHLFDQLDRLANADKDQLEAEVKRSETMQVISAEIIKAHNTQLDAVKLVAQYKGLNPNQATPEISTGNLEV
ncbi:hypothetical protein [Acinetobacter guillouiae]|uniref:hypothetical protein n=1 Tax=Acinetobacter guillouiae TaxID=106649 RepID=UPI0026E3E6BD|nr:hypothetical protein [Acinetobacter guillouiae]MDO6644676.1 hypothetical protein [Acinetobacter guillouiae]